MKTIINHNTKLILQLKRGDENAYVHLMENYHHKLCVYANSLINDSLLAEDIVQNVFIKLWSRRQKLNVKISLESLLYKSTYNEFIDQYRKNVTVLKVEQRYLEHLNSVAEDYYDNEKLEKALKMISQVVQTLPPKCKEIFVLSKTNGLSNIEIAEHLNISIKTVETQISRAYKVVRNTLNDRIKTVLFLFFNSKLGRVKLNLKMID
ncbi:RNA polymerase sigma factor [uncultured Croceitalea sp.]|uniref:RNA polymerase sigma factor n=1 Tax=uncultured Croceitalea sp. TaxID=1798908 RepID=UPI00374F32C4